jgi:hypothetical protein
MTGLLVVVDGQFTGLKPPELTDDLRPVAESGT